MFLQECDEPRRQGKMMRQLSICRPEVGIYKRFQEKKTLPRKKVIFKKKKKPRQRPRKKVRIKKKRKKPRFRSRKKERYRDLDHAIDQEKKQV